jgi:tyrosine-specific transport protein
MQMDGIIREVHFNLPGFRLQIQIASPRNAIVLVAGTTVGAGILALPAVTQPAGFIPSTLALTGAWMYMATTGLLAVFKSQF